MTTSSDPDEIRAEIERTRASLSDNVDALTDEANPKNIARRQVEKVKDAGTGLKDKIMGSADESRASLQDRSASLQGSARNVGDQVSGAPSAAKRKTQGNPLAAGLIAFGAGVLISALIPASDKETELAGDLKERAEPLKQEVSDMAKDVAGNLKEPAQQAAQSVQATAQDSADTVKQQGAASADEVKGTAQDAKQTVQDEGQSAADDVRGQAQDARSNVQGSTQA